jgi:hypothetical protein
MSPNADEKKEQVALVVPPEIAVILGRPPLTRVEDRDAYDRLFADLAVEWVPRTTTEWLIVKDIADLSWDVLRKRRAMADMLDSSLRTALQALLRSADPNYVVESQLLLELAWPSGRQEHAAARLKTELARYGLNLESALGQAFLLRCNELERHERMLASAEARRNGAIRKLNDFRSMRSAQLSLIEATEASIVPVDGDQ